MPPESTVLESLSCPGCFTRYGLRPERVHLGIRRARCFRCGAEFSAEEAIQRLLAPPPALDLAEASPTATLEGIQPEDLLELDAALSSPAPQALPEAPVAADPALTLGDLEGTEDEILEKTLVIEPAPAEEPALAEAEAGDPGGSFTSAKDAIAKLLGDSPAPASASTSERRNASRGNTMDVEATLDALENTLGGTPARSLSGSASATEPIQAMGSTVRLSPTELQAAMSAGAAGTPSPAQAPTVAIPSPISTRPAFAPQAEMAAPATGDPNLLKIQVGQETYQNVSLDQLTSWIEQGRVQDWHMVARQFSDNWIEAGKVPSLRPVFERVRRLGQSSPTPSPASPIPFETAPVKKGLFGWMSNRN
jgi:hypothetical protein